MSVKRTVSYALLVASAISGSAKADTITQPWSALPSDLYYGGAVAFFTDFDPRLGTLTNVTISGSYSGNSGYILQSDTSGTIVGVFDTFVYFYTGGAKFTVSSNPVTESLTFFPQASGPSLARVSIPFSGSFTVDASPVGFYTYLDNLGEIDVYAYANFTPTPAFSELGTDSHHSFTAEAGGAITYTYDPVDPPAIPEPPSLMLISAGIFALSAAKRCRHGKE